MRYAWGSKDLIPDLLSIPADGEPMAEVWFGTHHNSPSQVLDEQGGLLVQRSGELPFLVKFLAAAEPLSIQAHPSLERAQAMFGKQHPSYQDGNHKPELIIAVTEFRALSGFRPNAELLADLTALSETQEAFRGLLQSYQATGLRGAMDWIYSCDDQLVGQLLSSATVLGRKRARLIEELFEKYPMDRGVLVSVLMNLVTLQPGEALFLPQGNIHAYLEGLGVEVMAASDNVLRGGLTQKPIDTRELLQVLDYNELADPRVTPRKLMQGLSLFELPLDDFLVYKLEPSSQIMLTDLELASKAIVVCISGELTISTSQDEVLTLSRGEAAYLADARLFSVAGSGTGYLTMS
jgi:mannose-6-phosphate isomerase